MCMCSVQDNKTGRFFKHLRIQFKDVTQNTHMNSITVIYTIWLLTKIAYSIFIHNLNA